MSNEKLIKQTIISSALTWFAGTAVRFVSKAFKRTPTEADVALSAGWLLNDDLTRERSNHRVVSGYKYRGYIGEDSHVVSISFDKGNKLDTTIPDNLWEYSGKELMKIFKNTSLRIRMQSEENSRLERLLIIKGQF